MRNNTIMMIDYRAEGFDRYATTIASVLKKGRNIKLIGCCFTRNENHVYYSVFDDFIDSSKYGYNAKRILKDFHPDVIIVFAHRVFDYMFTIIAHEFGIPVFNFQHGMYMKHTVISEISKGSIKGLLLSKREKISQYLVCLKYIMNGDQLDLFKSLIDLLRGENLYVFMNRKYGKTCNADVSFIYGRYWKNYYFEEYKESYTKYEIIGYPELEKPFIKLNEVIHFGNDLPVVCYLAQTAVEDGTVDKKIFSRFIEALSECLGDINLVIKPHPRSDMKIYAKLTDGEYGDHVAIWDNEAFPQAHCYLGHDSTVIARALHFTDKTMIFQLGEGRDNPFVPYTKYVVRNLSELHDSLISMAEDTGVDSSDIINIEELAALNKHGGALTETAEIILKYLEH